MGRLASSGARFALSTGDIAYPGGSQANYGDLLPDRSRASAVFGPPFWTAPGGLHPALPRSWKPRLNASFPLIWPGASAAAGLCWTLRCDNYCCLDGTASAITRASGTRSTRGPRGSTSWTPPGRTPTSARAASIRTTSTTTGPRQPEYQWLEHDLATHPAQVKFAIFHFPLYSANATEPRTPSSTVPAAWKVC